MRNKKLKIAITGATGLLGRNLLFEIIKQNLDRLDSLEIIALGRNKNSADIQHRIRDIILNDGLSYFSDDKSAVARIKDYCATGIKTVYADLDKDKLGLDRGDFNRLKEPAIDFFFHLAALTDLRYTPVVEEALRRTNIEGTRQILHLVSALNVREFCYTGTAYSCGSISGKVKPDYINVSGKFRNPYEKTKLESEMLVRNFCKKSKIRHRCFRPSVMCGRLIESPIGAVNKFDVFYGWAAFFFQIKLKNLLKGRDIYKEPLNLDLRICYSSKSGLNIVPADYAAKVMYQVCVQGHPDESYYLVNNRETSHSVYIPLMLKALNITGPRQVDCIPTQMNPLERIYYKTAGRVFTSYITLDPILFDTGNLNGVLRKAKLRCPPVDKNTFPLLMNYAKKHGFGLNRKNGFAAVKAESK